MDTARQAALVQQAFLEIEQLFDNYDFYGQIESARPMLVQHRDTLAKLNKAFRPTGRQDVRWVDDLVAVYKEFGGQALDCNIYRRMKQLRQGEGRSWPPNARNAIRQVRQAHNVESRQYRGGPDLFRIVRPGLWRLKK